MNIKNTMKLVRALESGKYKKTTGQLRRGNRFCCLGVACDISKKGGWVGDVYLDDDSVLPEKVTPWLGWETATGEEFADCGLDGINDRGWTFKRIAKLLRKKITEAKGK